MNNWPFIERSTGRAIHQNLYYGFYDSGGICDGEYETEAMALAMIDVDGSVSTSPEDLGEVAVCILTGQQFIDRLTALGIDEATYGNWS